MNGLKYSRIRASKNPNGKAFIITISVPEKYLDYFDLVVGEWGLYPSRSEAIRQGIRTQIEKDLAHMKSVDDVIVWRKLLEKKPGVRIPNPHFLEEQGIKVIRRLD